MREQKMTAILIIIATWVLIVLPAGAANSIGGGTQFKLPNQSAPSDTDSVSVAQQTVNAPPLVMPKNIQRSNQGLVRLTNERWQVMRTVLADKLKRPAAALAPVLTEAQDLSMPGNKIIITPASIPACAALSFVGSTFVYLAGNDSFVSGQRGSMIRIYFPIAPNATYLASCSGMHDTDYTFRAFVSNDGQTSVFSGHATAQSNGSVQMVWTAPSNVTHAPASLSMTPSGLSVLGGQGYTKMFLGCDILRVQ